MSEKEIRDIIYKNINYYMDKTNTTRAELAEYIGVSQATISNWCNGTMTPRMSKIDKLCEFFNIQRSDLMEDRKERSKNDLLIKYFSALFAGENFTPKETEEIKDYIEFIKSKREKQFQLLPETNTENEH